MLQPKLDALIENFANMSSHVTSIENDWTKYKQTAIDFEENSMKINAEVSSVTEDGHFSENCTEIIIRLNNSKLNSTQLVI